MLASLAVRCAPNYRQCWPDGRGRSIDGLHLACIVREATAALGQRRAVARRPEFKPREATHEEATHYDGDCGGHRGPFLDDDLLVRPDKCTVGALHLLYRVDGRRIGEVRLGIEMRIYEDFNQTVGPCWGSPILQSTEPSADVHNHPARL